MGHYGMCLLGGRPVAGIGPQMGGGDAPPAWLTYLAVDDVEKTAEAVASNGGTVVAPPMDVGDRGAAWPSRQDPAGAFFGVWQAGETIGDERSQRAGCGRVERAMSRDPAGRGSRSTAPCSATRSRRSRARRTGRSQPPGRTRRRSAASARCRPASRRGAGPLDDLLHRRGRRRLGGEGPGAPAGPSPSTGSTRRSGGWRSRRPAGAMFSIMSALRPRRADPGRVAGRRQGRAWSMAGVTTSPSPTRPRRRRRPPRSGPVGSSRASVSSRSVRSTAGTARPSRRWRSTCPRPALNRERVQRRGRVARPSASTARGARGAARSPGTRWRSCAPSSTSSTPAAVGELAAIERVTLHDVKAVEYLAASGTARGHRRSPTSPSYALLLHQRGHQQPRLRAHGPRRRARGLAARAAAVLAATLARMAAAAAATGPMLARTHGQPATPTTMGKELAVFAHRLRRAAAPRSRRAEYLGKFNGATGTFAAHVAADAGRRLAARLARVRRAPRPRPGTR